MTWTLSRRLPSRSALVPLSMRFPSFSADGFLTSPPSPCHTHTLGQMGSFMPTFIKVPEPWVRVWLVPNEERTECKI